MTTHEDEWTALLSDYLDGDLSPADRARVEEHVGTCRECAQLLDEYRRVPHWLKSDPPSSPAPRVLAAVLSSLDERVATSLAPRSEHRRRWMIGVTAVAAAAALLVVTRTSRTPVPAPVIARTPEVSSSESYAMVVAQLERDINAARDRLGSRALGELQQSLAVIDRALDDAEKAQRADPANATLREYVRGMQELRIATMRAVASNIEGRRDAPRG